MLFTVFFSSFFECTVATVLLTNLCHTYSLFILSMSAVKNKHLQELLKNGLWTDGRTDGRTDGWTDRPFYRDVCAHLKIRLISLWMCKLNLQWLDWSSLKSPRIAAFDWLIGLRFQFTISAKSLLTYFIDFLFLAICKPLEIKIPDRRQWTRNLM